MRVDHVYVEVPDPDAVFHRLAQLLGAEMAWPMAQFGRFQSGDLALGGLNLEIVRFADTVPAPSPSRLDGIALRVDAHDGELALIAPGIRLQPSEPFGQDGVILWTNQGIDGLGAASINTFLCEYSPTLQRSLARIAARPAPRAELVIVESDRAVADRWKRLGIAASVNPLRPRTYLSVEYAGNNLVEARRYLAQHQLPIELEPVRNYQHLAPNIQS